MICGILPRAAIGHTYPLALSPARRIGCLYANQASFVLDYVARQKIAGTHLTYGYVNQLPVLPPDAYDAQTPWQADSVLNGGWIRGFLS